MRPARLLAVLAALPLATLPAVLFAQGVPSEIVSPGTTIATSTDADSARVNMGAVPLTDRWSLRFTHISDLRSTTAHLDGDAITATVPLFFGLATSVGVTWQRPQVASMTTGSTRRQDVVGGELGLAYALERTLGIGAKLTLRGGFNNGDEVVAGLDVGAAWRPFPQFSAGVRVENLLGPQFPTYGVNRTVGAGIGLRPFGSDALTLGLDALYAQSNVGTFRGAARVRLPNFGYLRAEGAVDVPGTAWRAGIGLDVVWGNVLVGGGAVLGGAPSFDAGALGFYATARIDGERDHGLPEAGAVVEVRVDGDLSPRRLARLLLRLETFRRDPMVRGVVMVIRDGVGGLAGAEELRESFERLHSAGKRVACHLMDASGSAYLACAGADRVTMDPAGTMRMAGIRTSRYFLGDALASLGVRTEFVRIGPWKSAAEQFTRRGSTPEARAIEEQLLDDFYAALLDGIATSRRWDVAHAREVVEAGPYSAREALHAGLLTEVQSRETLERTFAHALGARLIESGDYDARRPDHWAPGRGVAVLHIDGDIVDGRGFDVPVVGMHAVGDRDLVEVIDALASNDRIGAVVLRVDSPGGSAVASELVWRALSRLARHKTLVASFGSVAASGGYYVAAGAREIYADAATVTGSIGIFFGKVDISPLLARLNVGLELSRRGEHADMDSLFRGFTDEERTIVGRLIAQMYDTFVGRVADGRHRTIEQVDAVGQGRVFAGSRAVGNGLVDHVGGLLAAIDRARELANLPDECDVSEYPHSGGGLLETIVGALLTEPGAPPTARILAHSELGAAASWLLTVAVGGQGEGMALTEWPMGVAE